MGRSKINYFTIAAIIMLDLLWIKYWSSITHFSCQIINRWFVVSERTLMYGTTSSVWITRSVILELSNNAKPDSLMYFSASSKYSLSSVISVNQCWAVASKSGLSHRAPLSCWSFNASLQTGFKISLTANRNTIDLQPWNVRSRPPASLERSPESWWICCSVATILCRHLTTALIAL